MYLMNTDDYECDFCGFREKWDEHDDHRGDIWECESCGKDFCTSCFEKQHGKRVFDAMLSFTPYVLCPVCYKKNTYGVRDDVEGELQG